MEVIIGVLCQGMIYAIMAMGIYITYKILDFPDLTVDGTFPLGAAITAFILSDSGNVYLTLVVSFIAGAIAGMITGLIHVKCRVRDLLSGIIMMTALYTVNLRIAGTANLPLYNKGTIFNNEWINGIFPDAIIKYKDVIIILIVTVICKFLLDWYLNTKSGYLLRAVGDNEVIVTSLAKDKGLVKIVGLSIANGLVALSGCLMAHYQRLFEISMGTGTMIIGLASVIMALNIVKNLSFIKNTTAIIIGAVIYRGVWAAVIALGLDPRNMKLITAALLLIILVISTERKKKVKKSHA